MTFCLKEPYKIRLSIFVALMGSLLFGFFSGVISGSILYITEKFILTHFQIGILMSSFVLGALLGAFLGGLFSKFLGRKKTFFICSLLFLSSLLFIFFDIKVEVIYVARFLQGIGVGIISMLVPMYLAEISQKKNRGPIVSLNQVFIVLGVFISFLLNYFFSFSSSYKYMYFSSIIFIIILFFGSFFMIKSPYFKKGIQGNSNFHKRSLKIKKNKNIYPFFIGISLCVFQQITGINIIIYYSSKIFQTAHLLSNSKAIFWTILIGFIQVIASIFAIFLIKKYKRKSLLKVSLIGMSFSMFLLGISFTSLSLPYQSIFSMVLYLIFFSIGMGPLTWTIISEVFDKKSREKGVSISTFFNWAANFILSFIFMPLLLILKIQNIFYCLSIICMLAYFFITKYIVETKDLTFSEIQKAIKTKNK